MLGLGVLRGACGVHSQRWRRPRGRRLQHGRSKRQRPRNFQQPCCVHGRVFDQRRRSVYTTIRRNFLSPFLEVFDAPRPFTTLGRRDTTNVPAQSLAFLNDPFVIYEADRWAASSSGLEDEKRINALFEKAFSRKAAESEMAASKAYLAQTGGDEKWRDLAQSMFNLKEFIYLR